jgi:hypothetical protein
MRMGRVRLAGEIWMLAGYNESGEDDRLKKMGLWRPFRVAGRNKVEAGFSVAGAMRTVSKLMRVKEKLWWGVGCGGDTHGNGRVGLVPVSHGWCSRSLALGRLEGSNASIGNKNSANPLASDVSSRYFCSRSCCRLRYLRRRKGLPVGNEISDRVLDRHVICK